MIWINIKYKDGTGAITQCDAPNAGFALELMRTFFADHSDMAHHDGAPVSRMTAIDPSNPTDYAEARF